MSDLSEQIHLLRGQSGLALGMPAGAGPGIPPGSRLDVLPEDLHLRGLRTPQEIAGILHLRRQINLPAAVLADPGFPRLEKKETSPASSPRSAGGI